MNKPNSCQWNKGIRRDETASVEEVEAAEWFDCCTGGSAGCNVELAVLLKQNP